MMRSKSSKVPVQITVKGRRQLGVFIGSKEYKQQNVSETVQNWICEMEHLSDITKDFPHEAYTAFVFDYQHKFTHIIQTVPNISIDLKLLEHLIRHKFMKSILNGYKCNDTERKLFTLHVKLGGLSVCNPTKRCQI